MVGSIQPYQIRYGKATPKFRIDSDTFRLYETGEVGGFGSNTDSGRFHASVPTQRLQTQRQLHQRRSEGEEGLIKLLNDAEIN